MRKTNILISIILLGLILLTACSASAQSNTGQAGVEAGSSAGEAAVQGAGLATTPVPGAGDEPLAMLLALGTLRLEDTDYPVDAEQASALLPLWKAARSLSQSDTVATEELQAVIDQIQETMKAEQLAALTAMSLTFEDIGALAEELGLELGFGGGRFGDLSPEMQATMQAARESGQFPPGGFGDGGGFPGDGPGGGFGQGGQGGVLSPEQRQTAIAERGGFRRAGLGVPAQLLDVVIEFLEAKVQ